jgi:CheY-like chemotaxis protein
MTQASSSAKVDELSVLVLVVEDEQLVLDVIADALLEGGFQTEAASSGDEAIRLLDASASKYRAVVTDINLGGEVKGWDVGRHARVVTPEIPVIYMTGNAGHEWSSRGVPNSVLLTKPFAPAQVVTAVADLLNSSATSAAPPNAT